jgi:hypothetical protein
MARRRSSAKGSVERRPVALKVGERVEGADSIDRAQAALDTFAYGLRTDEANLVVTGNPGNLSKRGFPGSPGAEIRTRDLSANMGVTVANRFANPFPRLLRLRRTDRADRQRVRGDPARTDPFLRSPRPRLLRDRVRRTRTRRQLCHRGESRCGRQARDRHRPARRHLGTARQGHRRARLTGGRRLKFARCGKRSSKPGKTPGKPSFDALSTKSGAKQVRFSRLGGLREREPNPGLRLVRAPADRG